MQDLKLALAPLGPSQSEVILGHDAVSTHKHRVLPYPADHE